MNESTKLQNSIDRLRKRLILIVALFFIFVSLLLFKSINDSKKKSLIDYHIKTQENFKNLMAHSLDTVRYAAYNTFYSSEAISLRNATDLSPTQATKYLRTLHALDSTNPFIHSIYLLNKASNTVYTTSSCSSTLDQFQDKDAFTPNTHLLRLRQLSKNVWVYTLQFTDFRDTQVSMVVNIDAYLFNRSLFRDTEATEFIYEPEMDKFFSSTADSSLPIETLDFTSDNDSHFKTIGDYVYFYSYQQDYSLYIIKQVKSNTIISSISSYLPLFLEIIVITFILILILGYFINKYYYTPLYEIMDKFELKSSSKNSVNNAVTLWIHDQQHKMEEAMHKAKQDYLTKLLLNQKLPLLRNNLDFDTTSDIYICILDSLTNKNILKFFGEQKEVYTINNLHTVISNTVDIDGLSNYAKTHHIKVFLGDAKPFSRVYTSYQKLSQLYYLRILDSTKFFYTESDMPHFMTNFSTIQEAEQRLLYTFEHGRNEEINKSFQEWFNLMKSLHYNSLLFFYTKLYSSLRDRIRSITSISSLPTYQFENKLNTITDIQEINLYILSLMHAYNKYLANMKEEKILDLVSNAKDYIDAHLCDTDLTADSVAESMDYNATYLNRIFKSQYEMSMKEYINISRVELAKKLLVETDLSTLEISAQLGLENSNYFYTFFKKHTGSTPNQYRTDHKST